MTDIAISCREFPGKMTDEVARMGAGVRSCCRKSKSRNSPEELREDEDRDQPAEKLKFQAPKSESFRKSGNQAQLDDLDVIPVIPPNCLLVPLMAARTTSDLNDLYRRVINRNNLSKLILKALKSSSRNENTSEAVDALFDKRRRGPCPQRR